MGRVIVDELGEVDVYPVGLMSNICTARRGLRVFGVSREAFQPFCKTVRYIRYQLCKTGTGRDLSATGRDLSAIRRYLFNGYLAEPMVWPEDRWLTRCGSGWTRGRAVRDLRRRYRNAAPRQDGQR